MKVLSLFFEALLVSSTIATPFGSNTFEKRDGPPSCSTKSVNPPPSGTRCGVQGNIAKNKAPQNFISAKTKVATVESCSGLCRQTPSCGSFSYASQKCSLYKKNLVQNGFVAGKSTLKWYSTGCFQCNCGVNQTKQADGSCSCTTGFSYSISSKSCIQCPTGSLMGSDGTCACQGNQQLSADGKSCGCATGSSVADDTQPFQCVQDCPQGATRSRSISGNGYVCTCEQAGYYLSDDGTSCNQKQCPTEAPFNSTIGDCSCTQAGQNFNGTTCVRAFDPNNCPSGAYSDGLNCYCISGVFSLDGTKCVDPCSLYDPNKFTLFNGQCVCKPTFEFDSDGKCNCPGDSSTTYGQGGVFCGCPDGKIYSDAAGSCVCPANSVPGTCSCGANASLSLDNTSCDCPSGFLRSDDGVSCHCPDGLTQCYNTCQDLTSNQFSCGYCFHICDVVPGPNGRPIQYQCINSLCTYPSR